MTPAANDYNPIDNLTKPNSQKAISYQTQRVDFSKSVTGSIGPGKYETDR